MNLVEIAENDVIFEKQAEFMAFAEKILMHLGHDNWDLSFLLCNDAMIQELNARYRNKNESTDVLSFELGEIYEDEKGDTRYAAGDIAISLDTLKENATYFKVDIDEELKRLIVHGILHLDGQDHEDNDAGQPMLVLQEQLLAKFAQERIVA
ncbi:rRNA maturation RNase YbeY [Treponema sp.]